MARKQSKYKRCKKCKELVIDVENCANCANKTSPLSLSRGRYPSLSGKRGSMTLDVQEGNSGSNGDRS